eukprot:GEMP01058507.1.p1 GENE.GEMP01058507.1~~GEMP01058507.1.p1  ORF type:complete len:246 (+),score=58.17 GEMP01058507.1:122-859(+)
MRRRGPGATGLIRGQQRQEKLEELGEQMESVKVEQAREQCEAFKSALTVFAEKHRSRINQDSEFRNAFHDMCAAIGVDPLRSNKGFFAQLLGVGHFYTELGVQVLTITLNSRSVNGGVMEVTEILEQLRKMRNNIEISHHDVARAIERLDVLGGGVKLKRIGGKLLIISVPEELNRDQTMVLEFAPTTQPAGCVSMASIREQLGWAEERTQIVLNFFLREGLVWIDTGGSAPQYWFPSIALSSGT